MGLADDDVTENGDADQRVGGDLYAKNNKPRESSQDPKVNKEKSIASLTCSVPC